MQLSADVTVTGHELGHYRRRGRSRRHRQTQRGTPVWKTSICHLLRFQINQPARAPRTSNELEDRSTGERGERTNLHRNRQKGLRKENRNLKRFSDVEDIKLPISSVCYSHGCRHWDRADSRIWTLCHRKTINTQTHKHTGISLKTKKAPNLKLILFAIKHTQTQLQFNFTAAQTDDSTFSLTVPCSNLTNHCRYRDEPAAREVSHYHHDDHLKEKSSRGVVIESCVDFMSALNCQTTRR